MTEQRTFRDARRPGRPKQGEDLGPPWNYCDYEDMDARFIAAMQAAGYAITAPSTAPGTRAPRPGYERPDSLSRP